jgi:phage portal protein BeeE
MTRLPAPRSGWNPAAPLTRWWATARGWWGSAMWRRSGGPILWPNPDVPYTNPPPATEDEALALPPFGRGVALLCNAIAATDWFAQRWDGNLGVDVRLADQPAVLTDPDPTATVWNYKWAATEDGILFGNHFALLGDLDWRTGRPGWLVPVPADDVWMLTDGVGALMAWAIGGETFGYDELLHVSFGARSGELLGRGVLAQYADWLGGAVAAEDHAGSYFAGGALPPAVLNSSVVVTQQQADDLKAKWRDMTSTREPVILPAGYTLTPVVSNAEQAQLVQSRQWNATLVAMILGIPVWKLGLQGPSMTYQNVETADIDFVRDSADRYARPLSEAFGKWLMPNGTTVAWNYAGRMRADAKTTADVVTRYTGAGVLTIDEGRAVIGRPPLGSTTEPNQTPAGTPALTPEVMTP